VEFATHSVTERDSTMAMRPVRTILLALTATLGVVLSSLPASAQSGNALLLESPNHAVEALDFTTTTPEGEEVKLSDFEGQVVFLNFWATWCTPCLQEMPAMDGLQAKLQDEPFQVLAVNMQESAERIQQWRKKFDFSFPIIMDNEGEIGRTYGVDRIPTTYIIDRRGNVVSRALGPREWDGEEAVRYFRELIRSSAPEQSAAAETDAARTDGAEARS